jgi:IS30 family transposase
LTYTHLTQCERYQIQALKDNNFSLRHIAKQLARSASTIAREIKRAQAAHSYQAEAAHALALKRQEASRNAARIVPERWQAIQAYLRLYLSPEQVCGRLALEGAACISHESIYQHVYADKARGGDLFSYLRCQKARRKRYGSGNERRGQLKNRVCIEQRPAIVQARSRIGDWEGDTVIGHGNTGVLVTLVERCSRYTLVRHLPNREAAPVSAAILELLRPHKEQCLTLTFDNGKEFADHVFFGNCLGAEVFFAHPYHSWERGSNENTNGLLRQYFPKAMSFSNLSDIDVDDAAYRLNHRPRKCLGYRTPHEVFFDLPMRSLN